MEDKFVAKISHFKEPCDLMFYRTCQKTCTVFDKIYVTLWKLCSLRWEALGWFLFYAGNVCAAFGSAYYHLKPDDDRLIWDRLPVF
jgi:hypothetical protein